MPITKLLKAEGEGGAAALFYPKPGLTTFEQELQLLGVHTDYVRGIPKLLSFTLLSGKVFFGLSLSESLHLEEGCYLILCPAILASDGRNILGENITRVPLVKFQTSSIMVTAVPDAIHCYFYFKHLATMLDKHSRFTQELRKEILDHVAYCESLGYTTILDKVSNSAPKAMLETVEHVAAEAAKKVEELTGQQSLDFDEEVALSTPILYTPKTRH